MKKMRINKQEKALLSQLSTETLEKIVDMHKFDSNYECFGLACFDCPFISRICGYRNVIKYFTQELNRRKPDENR